MGRNVAVEADQILLRILGKPDAVACHSARSLTCLRISAKAFLTVLLRPSWMLLELWASILSNARLLEQLESRCSHLADLPLRGHFPPELEWIGMTNYREVHFKPYRFIYEVIGQEVFVYGILDGRRDMQSLLQRRLLR